MKGNTQAAEMDIQGLTEGCNRAIVVYSLEEDYFAPKGFRTRKMVILYDNDGFCRETVNKGISNIMIMHGQSLMKSHMYITNESGKWKKSLFQFAAFLLCIFRRYPPSDSGDTHPLTVQISLTKLPFFS
ncbi:hypothetical protein [Dysgonomonas sp. 521]|uniref:hypothetical protein n=1 Tax=Dysgonomonas sp. 521 TaxID=2302932 RepID=UPI0013D21ED1|nr:hypothetical protein [Dysgonomonas sp. 521]